MKKTRFLSVLLAVFFCVSLLLTGCNSQNSGSSSNSSAGSSVSSSSSNSSPAQPSAKPEKKYSQGVTDKTIKIGNSGPQTGPVASLGVVARGMNAYFKYINDNGGINGRTIEFIMLDDGYKPENTVAAMKKLVEQEKVFAVAGSIGTAGINAVKDYIKEQKIPMVSIATGASSISDPVIPNFFIAALNYALEGRALAQYAVNEMKGTKVGVFYQNDDFGKDYLRGISDYLKEGGKQVAAATPYNTTDIDFSTQALKMKEAGVDTIIIAAMKPQAAGFATELKKLGINAKLLANNSAGDDAEIMKKLAGAAWDGTIVTSYIPDPTVNNPKMETFRKYMKQYCPNDSETNATALSGWQDGEIIVQALKKCGDNLTWENFIAELEKLNNWSGDYALNITYTSKSHQGTRAICFLEARDGKNKPITEMKEIK